MNPAIFIAIYLPLFILLLQQRRQREHYTAKIAARRRKRKEASGMKELAKRFIGRECLVYTMNGGQHNGTVKEVADGAILLDNNGNIDALNLDYIVRIREYPRKKNGKKKSVVLD